MTVNLCKPLVRWVAALGLLGGLCGFLFFHGLADRDLWSSHEARAAMDAQSLLDGEAGAAPHLFDGRAELQKPPLYYWLVAGISWLRDGRLDEWSVRLPSSVAATACVLALFAFGTMVGRPQVGFFTGAILATAVHFTWLARIARIDMPLSLTTTVASLGFYTALRTGRVAGLVLAYLSIAAGLLLKGPIGAVLPAAVVVALLVVDGEWPAVWEWAAWLALLRRLGIWWGVPLAVGLALPWFVWADVETDGALFTEFVWHHNVERGLGGSTLRAHPVWFYGPQFVGDFLPWSPLVLAGFVYAWRSGSLRRDAEVRRRDDGVVVCEFQTRRLSSARLSGGRTLSGVHIAIRRGRPERPDQQLSLVHLPCRSGCTGARRARLLDLASRLFTAGGGAFSRLSSVRGSGAGTRAAARRSRFFSHGSSSAGVSGGPTPRRPRKLERATRPAVGSWRALGRHAAESRGRMRHGTQRRAVGVDRREHRSVRRAARTPAGFAAGGR
jgi:hypothetical protein